MKILKGKLLLMIFGLILVITACGNPLDRLLGGKDTDISIVINHNHYEEEGDGLRQTVLYYRNSNNLIVPIMKNIPWEEGIAKAALNQLIDNPILRDQLSHLGLFPTIPEGTEILGMSINDGLCKVDFTREVLSYNTEAEETALFTSIVYTLTEFPAIDRVQVLVEGNVIRNLNFGTQVSLPLERENINLVEELTVDSIPVVVFYKGSHNGEDSLFIPVTKGITALKADIKSVLVALLEGAPTGSGLFSEIPVGTTVNDVYVKDGIAYIDLSDEIRRIPDNAALQQSMIFELGLTLREIEPSITQVRILSGGQEIKLSSGVQLNLPVFSNTK